MSAGRSSAPARSPSPDSKQIWPSEMPYYAAKQIVKEAEKFAQRHFARLADPSHDWAHVLRVRDLAFRFRGCQPLEYLESGDDWVHLQQTWVTDDDEYCEIRCDYLVLELAALFHDLVDPKLFKLDSSRSLEDQAAAILKPFWDTWGISGEAQYMADEQKERVIKIICNIGWSKDERRRKAHYDDIAEKLRKAGGHSPTRQNFDYGNLYIRGVYRWPEFRAVSDADRIDAIGAIGLMRCAAYSGVTKRPLLPISGTEHPDQVAYGHIRSKLLRIKGDRLFHLEAKLEAERRQAVMEPFLVSLRREFVYGDPDEDTTGDDEPEPTPKRRRTQALTQTAAAT